MPKKVKSRELMINLAFLLVAVIFCLLVLELGLRFSYGSWSNFNSEMWRYSTEIKAPSDNPEISHMHMPDKESTLYGVDVKTNSLGFRDKEYPIEKPDGTTRILVLGDSVTLGWGVNVSDDYSEVLERMLNQDGSYEVMNAAVGNYNTEMEVAAVEEYLYLQPDIVVIGFFPNDGEKTLKVRTGPSYFLKSHLYIYPFFWDRYVKVKYLLDDAKYESKIHSFYTEEYGGEESISRSLSRLRNISEQSDFQVVVLVIPHFFTEFDAYDATYIHQFVMEQCEMESFVCIDTLPDFESYKLADVVISAEDAHPNRLGHKIIAEALYEVIVYE